MRIRRNLSSRQNQGSTLLSLAAIAAGAVAACLASEARAQLPASNPIAAGIPNTPFTLQLEDVIQLPDSGTGGAGAARIQIVSPVNDGSNRLFALDSRGKLYWFRVGDSQPTEFFDFGANISNFRETRTSGVRSFAFHPEAFTPGAAGEGKVYAAYDIDPTDLADGESHRSVISEWTFNANESVQANSRRDLLVQSQPLRGHNPGTIGFKPNLSPSDPDYGNLYISFGDGGNQQFPDFNALNTRAQDTTNFLGTLLRINPLEDTVNETPYTVPQDNPFVGQAGFLPEIWAYGLRNPHNFGWDLGGNNDLLIADIGQANIEEVNLGVAGANYGWSIREGTFDVEGLVPLDRTQANALPANHPTDPFTYPVVQYDHVPADADPQEKVLGSIAIAGGYVYRGTRVPELRGKYLFGNFAADSEGPIYAVDVDEFELRDDFSNLESLDNGFLAPLEKISLVDDEGSPIDLIDLVRTASDTNTSRTDLRFGYGNDGEVYVTSKRDGWIRRFVATRVAGDYNADSRVDAADFTLWRDTLGETGIGLLPDGDNNGEIDAGDYQRWQADFGAGAASGTSALAVPEPSSLTIGLVAGLASLIASCRRGRS